jgi:hypothetical protein
MFPKIFSRINIRQVHLDKGHGRGEECVADGDAGMGEGCRIDDDKPGLVGSGLLNSTDNLTLDVRLQGFDFNIVVCGLLR